MNGKHGFIWRPTIGLVSLILLAMSSAIAGDFATTEIIGSSADGRYVAIEEFGIQDGSGFPYATLFVIDVDNDSWVRGTPVRRRIDDDRASLADVRADALDGARATLDRLAINDDEPAELLAANPSTELMADPHRLAFNSGRFVPALHDRVDLALSEKQFTNAECPVPEIWGFRLTMDWQGDQRVLNDDRKIPKSRQCPERYRIYAVHSIRPQTGQQRLLITIQMESFGFEGPDARHLFIGVKL